MLNSRAYIKVFLTSVALFLVSFLASGQGTNIKFKHLSIKEGLSQSSINSITQDEMGFMWFGTQDGLNKFDGYEFTVFKHDIEDSTSLSSGFINCFYNDNKGNLWIGTNAGINILDHDLQKFLHIEERFPSLGELNDAKITDLTLSPDSVVWIGTDRGLYRFHKDETLEAFALETEDGKNLENEQITSLLSLDDERFWISTMGSGIYQYNSSTKEWKHYTKKVDDDDDLNISSNNVTCLYKSRNQMIYIGTDVGLNIYDPITNKYVLYTYNSNNPFGISSNFITQIIEDHLGNIWLGTNGGGLNKFDLNKHIFYTYKKNVNNESSIVSNDITSLFQDRSGILWVGTSVGLSKFDLLKQNFNHFQFDQGSISSISRNIVWSILSEGDILWVGSNEGLNKFDRSTNTNYSYTPSITVNGEKRANAIYSLARKNKTTLLVGTDGGLYEFNTNTGRFTAAYMSGARVANRTYDILLDSKDRWWFSTRKGLHVVNPNGSQQKFTTRNGLPSNVARVVFESEDGTIWIGTDGGLCQLIENNGPLSFKTYTYEKGNSNSLRNNTVLSLAQDDKGFIWVGTFGGGLNRLNPEDGLFISYTEKDGLPNNVIYGILMDEKDNLWCSTNSGLFRFNAETKSIRKFEDYDGLQSNEFNVGSYYKDESGELFFGGIKGVNSFFASNIQINKRPPNLVITDFLLFNRSVKIGDGILDKSVSVTNEIELSYRQNVFSLSFSALHYSLPERNRYAYKLEGFDENWIFDDNTRKVKYTNLDPGTYTFKVKGTNSDNIWSEEVHLDIIIKPPFWMIWWVQTIAILILLGSAFLFYRNRLNAIRVQKEKLEQEVQLRTIEVRDQKEEIEKQALLLEEEKEKLETLLLNVLPESTVEELKMKGKATARNYRQVTVMFTDFKGFTKISENLTPTELVSKLDAFFVKFDEIIEKYNVEKIKTIGDAYMCAGGIPIRNKSNPIDVVLAGLKIQRAMDDFKAESEKNGEPIWGLRLGIHTGVIIAGVIGIKRFAYDIWGDTVNVASRVETNGEVGMVNISGATYREVKDYFQCEYRGEIYAKNKGHIDMYFIHGIKPYLSIEGDGIEPNDTFWEYVNLNLFSPIKMHEAESNIVEKLKKELPENLYYHNLSHIKDVAEAAERIALSEGIHNEDLYALKMAALYHDAGFIEKYQNNESLGAEMARADLPEFGFSEEQIELIEQLIMVTFATKKATTLLEKILQDADLDYLGREDFHDVSDKLKKELLDRNMVRSDEHWDELQVAFLEKHEYHTETARKTRNELKERHLQEIRARLKKAQSNKVIN